MTSFHPARISAALSLASVAVAVVTTAGRLPWVLVGLVGGGIVVVGLQRGSRRGIASGCALALASVVGTGLVDASVGATVLGVAATLLAWDFGEQAISLGEQLGPAAGTTRAELVHAGASLAIAGGGVGLASLAYYGGAGGQPLAALVLLLFGAIALTAALEVGS